MKLPSWGLFLLAVPTLTGCLAPMTQRQAQTYAQLSLRERCNAGAPCRFVKAQHLKTGWLMDYDAGAAVYGVMVHESGATEITVWDKGATTPR